MKSPNLEVISNADQLRGAERRRLPRLSLTAEQFRLSSNGKIFSVQDLSVEGMAIRIIDSEDLRLFTVGAKFEGLLNLKGNKYTVRGHVRHVTRELVGCEFGELDEPVKSALQSFLDPAVLGQEIRPIPSAERNSLWYHGPSGTDLILHRGNDGQYHRMMLYVLGSFVQWEQEKGLSTGRTDIGPETGETLGIVRFDTLLLSPDPELDRGKLQIAKTLILSSNLPQDLKGWCVRHLQ
ncbi:MAG: PilZ domain-containing protein [Bdellovibrionota bacterium]